MSRVDDIKRELRRQGSVQLTIEDDEEAAAWRVDARAAARSLGRPVETLRHESIVVAVLRDWPANELEEEVQRGKLYRAVMSLPDLGS